ncbi:MAG TPA: chaperonin GroEL, partial [Polyangiaceae bacterium]|nr:chaperonin GroEL [Polyangiaceae bacterium]
MSKQIAYHSKARKEMKLGLDALANAVKVTLGPGGRCVAYEKSWGAPGVTKDGVTVAKEIELAGKFQNMGCEMVRQVASRTNDDTGDGTTTATVLAQAIYGEGLKLIEAGFNPMDLKRGIDLACTAVVEHLKTQAKKVSGKEDIQRIGTVSANGEETVGKLLADALEKVSADGVVTIEEAKGLETDIDIVEGMQWDRGYLSPYFITDQQRLVCELENALVLVHEKKISSLKELLPVLELANQRQTALLIVAEDVDGEALAALTLNKLRGVLKVAAVKAPGFGDRRKEMLKDIAILTGATAFMEGLGRKLESVDVRDLGQVRRAVLDKETCTLVDGQGDKAAIAGRIQQIKREVKETNSDYDKEKLNERLAKLAGGVAVIRVGAATEVEMRERKARFDDALNATRAAIAEGVVPGGGVALLRAASALTQLVE